MSTVVWAPDDVPAPRLTKRQREILARADEVTWDPRYKRGVGELPTFRLWNGEDDEVVTRHLRPLTDAGVIKLTHAPAYIGGGGIELTALGRKALES